MSALIDSEPLHWHDDRGDHRMRDPRTIEGYASQWWDADERAYVRHLEAHEAELAIPTPRDDDSLEIVTLFEVIDNAKQTIKTAREAITAHRMKG